MLQTNELMIYKMGRQIAAMLKYRHPYHKQNIYFNSKIQIQPGYEDYKHLLEYIQDRCLWFNKEESMIYTNNVGIKDETIDCSHGSRQSGIALASDQLVQMEG